MLYVARDKNGRRHLFPKPPNWNDGFGVWEADGGWGNYLHLSTDYPSLKRGECIKVKLVKVEQEAAK